MIDRYIYIICDRYHRYGHNRGDPIQYLCVFVIVSGPRGVVKFWTFLGPFLRNGLILCVSACFAYMLLIYWTIQYLSVWSFTSSSNYISNSLYVRKVPITVLQQQYLLQMTESSVLYLS